MVSRRKHISQEKLTLHGVWGMDNRKWASGASLIKCTFSGTWCPALDETHGIISVDASVLTGSTQSTTPSGVRANISVLPVEVSDNIRLSMC